MKKLISTIFLMWSTGTTAAPTLLIDTSGQLTGAKNVEVQGRLYDVEFLDGTCIELYEGCDSLSDFVFDSESAALSASQSLLDDVFVDGPEGEFDSIASLTLGCPEVVGGLPKCTLFTPYDFSTSPDNARFAVANNSSIFNIPIPNDDRTGLTAFRVDTNPPGTGEIFAVWTKVQEASLTISPPSSSYLSTQVFDFALIVEGRPDLSVVGGSATFDGIDVSADLGGCLVPGVLLGGGGGQTFRCPHFDGSLLAPGIHTLVVTLNLSDGSSISDSVTWNYKENSEL